MGTNEHGATNNSDLGISEFNSLYSRLWSNYGKPKTINVPLDKNDTPGMKNPDVEMTFELANKKTLNINLLLIDKSQLQMPTPTFKARLQDRIQKSDLVSYNGHSGLGSNIRALVHLGRYEKGRYQVFYFNGCDTFSYVDSSLAEEHLAVNPGFGTYKFVDFISNSMPSPFGGFASSSIALVNSIVGMKHTYKQILNQFSSYQRAVIMGEEDNLWPKPFG